MKKIEAIIKPFKIMTRRRSRAQRGMTVTEVRGFGRQRATASSTAAPVRRRVPAEGEGQVLVTDDLVDKVVRALADAARTGQIGDGKIFVRPVSDAVRIRTGETGDAALL
jgi:nitrogen regulatory protein PII